MEMLSVRAPTIEEIVSVKERIENGFELDDREIWIFRNYLG
jgi:hypothetical protein